MKAQLNETLFNALMYLIILSPALYSLNYVYNQYINYKNSDEHTCVSSYYEANWAHIKFISTNHHYNWCASHKLDWYELSNYRVQREADKIRLAKGWKK